MIIAYKRKDEMRTLSDKIEYFQLFTDTSKSLIL